MSQLKWKQKTNKCSCKFSYHFANRIVVELRIALEWHEKNKMAKSELESELESESKWKEEEKKDKRQNLHLHLNGLFVLSSTNRSVDNSLFIQICTLEQSSIHPYTIMPFPFESYHLIILWYSNTLILNSPELWWLKFFDLWNRNSFPSFTLILKILPIQNDIGEAKWLGWFHSLV